MMRKIVAAFAALAALGACSQQQAAQQQATQATQTELVARGRYLVTGIAGCNDCHTPMTQQGPDMAHSLQGSTLAIRLMPQFEGQLAWAPAAPQIAGGPAGYTDEQFARLLMTGEKPDGTRLRAPMPQYRMNADDARAIVAYVKTVPRAQ
jgi:mono/diheme cytochrome c family protein